MAEKVARHAPRGRHRLHHPWQHARRRQKTICAPRMMKTTSARRSALPRWCTHGWCRKPSSQPRHLRRYQDTKTARHQDTDRHRPGARVSSSRESRSVASVRRAARPSATRRALMGACVGVCGWMRACGQAIANEIIKSQKAPRGQCGRCRLASPVCPHTRPSPRLEPQQWRRTASARRGTASHISAGCTAPTAAGIGARAGGDQRGRVAVAVTRSSSTAVAPGSRPAPPCRNDPGVALRFAQPRSA